MRIEYIREFNSNIYNIVESFINNYNGLIFHDIDFNLITSKYIGSIFYYLMVYNNRELVGICPVHKIGNNHFIGLMDWGSPYGGFLYDNNKISLEKIIKNLKFNSKEILHYWSNPFDLVKSRFLEKKSLQQHTAVIKLRNNSQKLFSNYISKNTRHNIRRANKKGVTISTSNKFDDLITFLNLKKELDSIAGLKSFPKNYYYELYNHFNKKNMFHIFIAYHYLKPVSGLIILEKNEIAHAWIAGRIKMSPKNIYQNELLWWKSIEWANEQGFRYFDLCVVDENKLPNIAQFKLGFSKDLYNFYTFTKKSYIYRIKNRLKKNERIKKFIGIL